MMRFDQVKALVLVDLLQANRQSNQENRKTKVNKSNLWMRLFLQNGLFILIFVLLFGTVFFNVNLADYPGLYTQTFTFIAIFVISQLFQLIFNLFFDDANLSEYLSLPFTVGELFLSKLLTIVLNTAAFFILPFVLVFMLGWQTGHPPLVVFLVALFCMLIFMAMMILIPFIFLYSLHQIPFYLRHKKTLTIILYTILFISLFYFIYASDGSEYTAGGSLDPKPYALFMGFYEIFIPESSLSGWIKMGRWVLVTGGLLFSAFKWMVPHLYAEDQTHSVSKIKVKKQRTKNTRTIRQLLIGYQFRQLQDTTFILQMVFSKLYFPLIIIAPIFFGGGRVDASFLSEVPGIWGVFVLLGFVFSFLSTGEISVSGVILSFDKENFHYFKSLPLSFLNYMQFKFWFSFIVEWLIGGLILGGIAFYIQLPLLVTLSVFFGFTLGTYVFVLYFFMRDYRLLNLDWTNFTELMRRGLNQFVRVFIQFALIIITLIALMSLSFWLLAQGKPLLTIIISIGLTLLPLLAALGIHQYAKKKFWIKFVSV